VDGRRPFTGWEDNAAASNNQHQSWLVSISRV
jgi:hypothetical protein